MQGYITGPWTHCLTVNAVMAAYRLDSQHIHAPCRLPGCRSAAPQRQCDMIQIILVLHPAAWLHPDQLRWREALLRTRTFVCRVSIVAEQFIRMLHHVGMPKTDLDYIQGNGRVVGEILKQGHPRSTLFTGSQKVAEQLALDLKGKVCTRSPPHRACHTSDLATSWQLARQPAQDIQCNSGHLDSICRAGSTVSQHQATV